MTESEFKKWIGERLSEIAPSIGSPPASRFAAIVAEAKSHCCDLGAPMLDFALTLPDSESVKSALTCKVQLKRCLAALQPAAIESDFISFADCAKLLGVSPRSVRRRVYDGTLPPPIKMGRNVRFRRLDIENYQGRYA